MKLKVSSITGDTVVLVLCEGAVAAKSGKLRLRGVEPSLLAELEVGSEVGFDLWPLPSGCDLVAGRFDGEEVVIARATYPDGEEAE